MRVAVDESSESRPHVSHNLKACSVILFCWTCGAQTTLKDTNRLSLTKKDKKLSEKCPGEAQKLQGKLCRMRKGHHPQTGKFAGPVQRAEGWQ